MKGTRAAIRYAKALMQLSEEKNLLENVILDIKLIHSTIKESRELELMLNSPLTTTDKKREILKLIFQGRTNELSLNFMDQIAAQGRENLLSIICEKFIDQYNQRKNIAKVSVTSAIPLSDDLRKELLTLLKTTYHFSNIELNEKVDEALIGGMVLRIGDKQLDASIRRKLTDIKQELVHA